MSNYQSNDSKNRTPRKGRNKKKLERQEKEIIDTEKKEVSDVIGSRSALRRSDENDPSWYAQDIQLLKDAFSITTAERLGLPIRTTRPNLTATAYPFNTDTTLVVPGIMNFMVLPEPGISTNANSAVNVAAKKLFSQVRRMNSGYSNYEPTDLMLYLLAIDNIYMLWNWLVRLYGIINLYSSRNAYLPEGLLASMNVNRSIIKDACQLRTLINLLQSKINTFAVPSYLTYFTRHAWLFSNIWLDSNNAKAQMYIMNPHSLYKWVEQTEATQPAYLTPRAICMHDSAPFSIDGLQSLVNEMINPVFYSEDFALISGDIVKSFGREACFILPTIEEHYTVVPTYSPEVLTQLSNAKFTGNYSTTLLDTTFRITQAISGTGDLAVSSIVFNPTVKLNYYGLEDNHYLYNFHTDEVTPEIAAVATRLNFVPHLVGVTHEANASTITASFDSCSSELVLGLETYTFNPNDNGYIRNVVESAYYAASSGLTLDDMHDILQSTQFDWAPLMKVTDSQGRVYYFSDLDNYTQIDLNTLISMNDVALLSMFGIPGVFK